MTDVLRPPLPYTDTTELLRSGPAGTGDGPTLKSVLEAWLGRLDPSGMRSSVLGDGLKPVFGVGLSVFDDVPGAVRSGGG